MTTKLNHQSSKEEEIKEFARLVKTYKDTGTYLQSLINDDLLRWFSNQVNDDQSTDLHQAMFYWNKLASESHEQAQELQNELIQTKDTAQAIISEKLEEIENLMNTVKDLKKERDELKEANEQDFNALYDAKRENEKMADEIIHLKAKLYDLQNS